MICHSPHLKVVCPSNAADAKGYIKAAIRDDFPVVFISHRLTQYVKGPVPVSDDFVLPFGKADVKRTGKDITIVGYSAMILKSMEAAEKLKAEGIDVEVVDLRSLVPMDANAIVKSISKTRRLLIAHESMKRAGFAGEILWRTMEASPEAVHDLKVPARRLGAPNIALPHGGTLAKAVTPQVDDIVKAVKEICK